MRARKLVLLPARAFRLSPPDLGSLPAWIRLRPVKLAVTAGSALVAVVGIRSRLVDVMTGHGGGSEGNRCVSSVRCRSQKQSAPLRRG